MIEQDNEQKNDFRPMSIPRVNFSRTAKALGSVPDHAVKRACQRFREEGCMVLEDILSPRYVEEMRKYYVERYSRYLAGERFPDAYEVGARRSMVTAEIEGPFNSSRLYGNRFAMPIIRGLLGRRSIIGAFNVVTSMPGSRTQHLHADHPGLFRKQDIDGMLPVYSVSLAIPLVDLNKSHGTTRFYPGTHITTEETEPKVPYFDPDVPAGSAILFDIRVRHRGTRNVSKEPRPIVYAIYNRYWFRDAVNYDNGPPVSISAEEFEKVPKKHRKLFEWARVWDN